MEQICESASDEAGLKPLPRLTVPISERADRFRKRYFPDVTQADWNDWHWQIKHSIDSFERLGEIIKLTENELSVQNYLKITKNF